MANGICIECGNWSDDIHQHHVFGREVSDETVPLCQVCHVEHHRGMLISVNSFTAQAVKKAEAEIARISSKRYCGIREMSEIYDKHGYGKALEATQEAAEAQWREIKKQRNNYLARIARSK